MSGVEVSKPIQDARRVTKVARVCCVMAVPLAVWAGWPLHTGSTPAPVPTIAAVSNNGPSALKLDVALFDAPLWLLDQTPPAVVSAPPPPLRVRLVGLVAEGGVLKAVVYNLDTDELLVVGPGERVGVTQHRVTAVDSGGVTLAHQGGSQRLLLDPEGGR